MRREDRVVEAIFWLLLAAYVFALVYFDVIRFS